MPLIHGALKRAILARLKTLDFAEDVQVEPTMPPVVEPICIYLNPPRWVAAEPLAEHGLVQRQTITIEARIRVELDGGNIAEAESIAEEVQARAVRGVLMQPYLLDGRGDLQATSGDADPTVVAPDPESKVIVNLGVTFTAIVNVGVQ